MILFSSFHNKVLFLNLCNALNSPAPSNTKAALKSKIVAEFTVSQLCCGSLPRALSFRFPTPVVCAFAFQPQSLLEQLSRYKRAAAEEELREKQLGALRVDLCSPEALKRLKGQVVLSSPPPPPPVNLSVPPAASSPQTFIPCKRLACYLFLSYRQGGRE